MWLVGSQGILSATEILIAAAVFCLVFLLIQSFKQHVPKGLKSPPGPRGLPILGNVLELRKDPHLVLTRLSQRYGDVMEIRIGTRPVLVLSGLDTIKQALVKQGEDFMGRPDLHSSKYISNGQSLAFSPDSGDVWKARRKLAQNALKTFSITPSSTSSSTCLLEEHVSKEADYLVTKFLQLMEEQKSFDPYRYLVVSVANVISAICFGRRYDHNDQELLSLISLNNEFGDVAASGNPADFIPVLQYLPNRAMDLFKDINRRFSSFVQKIIEEHYSSFDREHIRDVTDSLIENCQENQAGDTSSISLSSEKILNIVNDLFGAGENMTRAAVPAVLSYAHEVTAEELSSTKAFSTLTGREVSKTQHELLGELVVEKRVTAGGGAGSQVYLDAPFVVLGFDTITSALSWSLLYLALYPDIQKKIQEELDQTVGQERRPRLSDRSSLPYLEAFILEMFRHSSFLPFTIPHCTTKGTVLNGYHVPKDRCVFVNQWQVNHDEKLWKDPSAFKPERFLSADGRRVERAEGDKVLIFGLGKRRCLGETIGRWELFLFLSTLLQRLAFGLRGPVDPTPLYGLTMKYRSCDGFHARRRFPAAP